MKWYTWFPVHVAASGLLTFLLSEQYFRHLFPGSGAVVEMVFHAAFFLVVLYLLDRLANGAGPDTIDRDTKKDDVAS